MTFDPATFLNAEYNESLDTKVVPCPVGEYLGLAEKVDVVAWSKADGSSSGLKLVIIHDIQDDNVRQLLGRDVVRVPQDQLLDLTETGELDFGKGKNVGLGRIREAYGLNTPGEPFSFGMIQGRLAKVMVSHRTAGEDIYAEVKKIAKAS